MVVALGLSICCHALANSRGEVLPGPIEAQVLRVIDGDTILVRARVWLGQEVETMVRLIGVDAPELRARCIRERELAEQARDFLQARLADGQVRLRQVAYDKYGGRILAKVETADGEDMAELLLKRGLVHPYAGAARQPWCG